LVLALLIGCGGERQIERDVVARIEAPGGALELDRRVVRELAIAEGIDEDLAREQALDRMRLVAARRLELAERETPPEQPDDLDPLRREHIQRAALVRLWLREVFEPAHAAATIPASTVEHELADANLSRRRFHPELYFVCQVLIVPSETGEDGRNVLPPADGEEARRWHEDATLAFAPIAARISALGDELLDDRECALIGRIVNASARSFDALSVRFERFAFAPSEVTSFAPEWVEQVGARTEPGVVGPFATRFGVHLVVINAIEPALLADGSLPPDQLAAAREAELRATLLPAWRAQQLEQTLAAKRERNVVARVAD
jgi:hypothetical protein